MFESLLDIIIIVNITLVIAFTLTIIKLRSLIRSKEITKENVEQEKLEEPIVQTETTNLQVAVEAPETPEISTQPPTASPEAPVEPKMPFLKILENAQKAAKSPKVHPEKRVKDCPHQYGYLRTLPKNTPIPNECFACPVIVECLYAKSEMAIAK